ncbi:AEC family transporter [Clostridium pasteurianum]|uniref:AEC family transporter n=1 Tax=Clostridium pasteurianum TaxID=1501 RepID=UPI002260BC5A|nr:AEC family transporter [Clostridium pasteurianum]UZW13537.1 AEC family transporter [Clostridium pasteurianum]
MKLFLQMLNLQLAMLILIIIGIISRKRKIININAQKCLSNLLIYLILPCNIIISFQGKLTSGLIKNSLAAFCISLVIQIISIFLGKLLFRRFSDKMQPVMNYGLICSNSSFIGLPVINNIFNSTGVLYTSIFQIPIRITMWTSGLTQFTGRKVDENGKKQPVFTKQTIKSLIFHPCIIAVFLGLLIMAFSIKLPDSINRSITFMSQCTIPISMIVIGCILSECKVSQIFDKSTFYFTFIRLISFPLLVFVLLKLLKVDPLIIGVSTLLTGMPAGATTAILADKYGCDAAFASAVIFISTIFSIVTVPILCTLF